MRKIRRAANSNSEKARVEAERRSAAGVEGLAAEAFRKSTRRKSHLLAVDEKSEKARVDAEKRNAARAKFLVVEAARSSARIKINPLKVEQKAEIAVADADRYRQCRLTVEQNAENFRIETERRNAESSQVVLVRLIVKRHRYATRYATVADSVVVNPFVSNKVLNVQP